MDATNENNKVGKLELLNNPRFLAYLSSLPVNSFKAVAVIDEKTGGAKYLISKQVGENPPSVHVASEE